MGYLKRGVRDGSGPYKGSLQRKGSKKGKRRLAGQPCPSRKKK